jgi:hypothetical protein
MAKRKSCKAKQAKARKAKKPRKLSPEQKYLAYVRQSEQPLSPERAAEIEGSWPDMRMRSQSEQQLAAHSKNMDRFEAIVLEAATPEAKKRYFHPDTSTSEEVMMFGGRNGLENAVSHAAYLCKSAKDSPATEARRWGLKYTLHKDRRIYDRCIASLENLANMPVLLETLRTRAPNNNAAVDYYTLLDQLQAIKQAALKERAGRPPELAGEIAAVDWLAWYWVRFTGREFSSGRTMGGKEPVPPASGSFLNFATEVVGTFSDISPTAIRRIIVNLLPEERRRPRK